MIIIRKILTKSTNKNQGDKERESKRHSDGMMEQKKPQ
jgi:hypothetical protein